MKYSNNYKGELLSFTITGLLRFQSLPDPDDQSE